MTIKSKKTAFAIFFFGFSLAKFFAGKSGCTNKTMKEIIWLPIPYRISLKNVNKKIRSIAETRIIAVGSITFLTKIVFIVLSLEFIYKTINIKKGCTI